MREAAGCPVARERERERGRDDVERGEERRMGGGSKGREQGAGLTCVCLSLVSQMEETRAIHGRNGTVERRGTCTCSICMHVHVHACMFLHILCCGL